MRSRALLLFIAISAVAFSSTASYALVPLENLILGDFSERYERELLDPLDYIFSQSLDSEALSDSEAIEVMNLYRGFYEQGRELDQFCEASPSVNYSATWQEIQAKRSVYASLQYIGLDIVIRSLAAYAKYFEFTEDEYTNLIDNYVGNFCSPNLTVISIKELRSNMMMHFRSESNFRLPKLEGNPLMASSLRGMLNEEEVRKREFKLTLDLFTSFCSWGNDTENLRLLIPLIRNPQIMSFVFRQMDSKELRWSHDFESLIIDESQSTVKVLCRGLICRREGHSRFGRDFPRSVGSSSIRDDLQRLYCTDMVNRDFQIQRQDPTVRDFIDNWTFDEQNLMVAQFLSLITGVPDLFIWSASLDDAINFTRASMDDAWNRWAAEQTEQLDNDLYFEESLTLELVDREFYFDRFTNEFRVEFDLNLGEFDRVNQKAGKVSSAFHVKISNALLKWARENYMESDPRNPEEREEIEERLRRVITPQVESKHDFFHIPPWEGDLTGIIIEELISQLLLVPNYISDRGDDKLKEIPIVFNYGFFALNYIRHLRDVEHERLRRQEIIEVVDSALNAENID